MDTESAFLTSASSFTPTLGHHLEGYVLIRFGIMWCVSAPPGLPESNFRVPFEYFAAASVAPPPPSPNKF